MKNKKCKWKIDKKKVIILPNLCVKIITNRSFSISFILFTLRVCASKLLRKSFSSLISLKINKYPEKSTTCEHAEFLVS